MGTMIVLIALGAIVALIIRSMIKDKKSGKQCDEFFHNAFIYWLVKKSSF